MIVGEKVILKDIDPDSIEWMRKQRNNPELRKYFREWKDISKHKQQWWYDNRGNNTDDNHVYFEIRAKERDAPLIGCCNLSYINWQTVPNAEFGIYIAQEYQGNGYAKEAMILMLDFAFYHMNLHKVYAEVFDNNPAIDFYRHLGFVDEGVLRDAYFENGKYKNSYMIGMLQEEWFNNRNGEA